MTNLTLKWKIIKTVKEMESDSAAAILCSGLATTQMAQNGSAENESIGIFLRNAELFRMGLHMLG